MRPTFSVSPAFTPGLTQPGVNAGLTGRANGKSMDDSLDSVVITGAGLATSLGLTRTQVWEAILQGRVGMGPLDEMEQPIASGKGGGQAMNLPSDFAPDDPREVRYLRWTIADALREAVVLRRIEEQPPHPNPLPRSTGGEGMPYRPERCAILLGTTLHGMRAAGRFLRSGDFGQLQDFLAGSTLARATRDLPFAGLSATTCSACSSSLGSIALAVTLLQTGEADLVIAGGYDTISEYVYGGFNSLRLVADGPLRPFARGRQGMKLAEGYGIVVLERGADAARRGAKPIATILGWGESADAHHLTQPHPQGDGAARAIEQAMARAALSPADIDLIGAHATGTPDNDAGEYAAFSRVFGQRLPQVPLVAFKSHLGHTLGGAGAVELILSAMALSTGTIPACANVRQDEIEFPNLRVATGKPQAAKLGATLNTSLGFGGANTCVILGLPERKSPLTATLSPGAPRAREQEGDVFITGVGVVLPDMIGNEALLARLGASEASPAWEREAGGVPDSALEGLLNARRVRRMSDYVKLTLAAATLACHDAGIGDTAAFAADCAAVLGSMHGSSNYSTAYYEQIVREGLGAANPMMFAEAVPNAGAAQLSLMLSLKGACQTVIGTRTAGLDAIALAAARIRGGVWDRAIVGGGEEHGALVNSAYRHCGLYAPRAGGCAPFGGESGFVAGAGAVALVLESRESIERRGGGGGGGGKPRARIERTAAASGDRAKAIDSIGRVLRALGSPENLISSASGTWIDRAEAAAIRRCDSVRLVTSVYGHAAETFSASPLAGIAAVLLSGKWPRLVGGAWDQPGARGATGDENAAGSFASICTDFTGCVSGVRVAALA
jgi:3-oxoacyl-[acyl-carrier-protein] synthase II